MNQYYSLSTNKRPSFLSRIFRKNKVKPVVRQPKNKINPSEFYKKYGIIYTGNIEGSCINALF